MKRILQRGAWKCLKAAQWLVDTAGLDVWRDPHTGKLFPAPKIR